MLRVLIKNEKYYQIQNHCQETASIVTKKSFRGAFNFIVVSDWGWNGYKHQQEVADQMSITADSVWHKFIASCGDNFQINGIASTQDPLWIDEL